MDGIADIIPPAPTHDGLAALLAPAADSTGGLLLVVSLLALLALLTLAWFTRRRLVARVRLALARRSLRAGRADEVDMLLRRHHALMQLHPAKPPVDVGAECWRVVVESLHAARFGANAVVLPTLNPLLSTVFTPSPLAGEGGGEGGCVCKSASLHTRSSPSLQPSPIKGEGVKSSRG